MSAVELLTKQIRARLPGANVSTATTDGGYALKVVAGKFVGVSRTDREAMVYAAIERAPLELLAKIVSIDCRT